MQARHSLSQQTAIKRNALNLSPDEGQKLTEMTAAAMRQASAVAVERAKRTGTPLIVWQDGRVTELSAEEAEQRLASDHDKPTDR